MVEDFEISVNEIRPIRGVLVSPQLHLIFSIKNRLKDHTIRIEKVKFDSSINVNNWVPELGSGFVFEKIDEIPAETESTFESKFKLEYGTIMAINSRVLDRHDVVFKIRVFGNYSKNNESQHFSTSELRKLIHQSEWARWYRGWMDDLNRLKAEIGEDIVSLAAKDIGIALADHFKDDLNQFLSSELTSIKPILKRVSKIGKLIEFTKTKIGGFLNEDWALAVLALTLLETLVNLKLTELDEEPKNTFKDRVSKLTEKINEVEAKDLSTLRIEILEKYQGRNIIVHASHVGKVDAYLAENYFEFIKRLIMTLWE